MFLISSADIYESSLLFEVEALTGACYGVSTPILGLLLNFIGSNPYYLALI
tara:strand:+ start:1143 stop:1295 length:153 start_codon:yes stop_codon:yes gene_type:complete